MTREPTGKVERTARGTDVTITRPGMADADRPAHCAPSFIVELICKPLKQNARERQA